MSRSEANLLPDRLSPISSHCLGLSLACEVSSESGHVDDQQPDARALSPPVMLPAIERVTMEWKSECHRIPQSVSKPVTNNDDNLPFIASVSKSSDGSFCGTLSGVGCQLEEGFEIGQSATAHGPPPCW